MIRFMLDSYNQLLIEELGKCKGVILVDALVLRLGHFFLLAILAHHHSLSPLDDFERVLGQSVVWV
jgi:hypothetical protein